MGNAPGKQEVLSSQQRDAWLEEYFKLGGISEKNSPGGWTNIELGWLLTAFWQRCSDVAQEKIKEDVEEQGGKKKDEEKRSKKEQEGKKKDEEKKAKKEKKREEKETSINQLFVTKNDAVQYIVVFNQHFVNYPYLTDRFWSVIDTNADGKCSFMEYTTFLYYITRGSWTERMAIAFKLFNAAQNNFVTREEITELVAQVGEFLSNVARGVLTVQEFITLKVRDINQLFGNHDGLTLEQFTQVAAYHFELISCYEILDMVFGRVVRKLESSLKRPCVFGRYLQETALGNVKDITGGMPFVPEVVASAIQFLEKHNALGTEELFRVSVSSDFQKEFTDKLNAGTTLRSLLQPFEHQRHINEDIFLLLGNLIKMYCRDLVEPLFTTQGSRQIIVVQQSKSDSAKKLEEMKRIYKSLPVPNQFFIGTLLPFLKRVSIAQQVNPDKCMSSYNLGVVFAPCTMYDPAEPGFGAGAAPHAFELLIENEESFRLRSVAPSVPIRKPCNSDHLTVQEGRVAKLIKQRDELLKRHQ